MQIPVDIYQMTEKFFAAVQPKNARKLEFADHSWLPSFDQPHSGIVVFAMINFHTYNIIVTRWKHGIGPNYIITINEELEFISTSMIELVNIDKSLHEEDILIFITNKYLNITEKVYFTEDDDGICFELSY